MKAHKIINLIALAILVSATAMNWFWVWGLYFLYLATQSLRCGETTIMSTISRSDEPFLYWSATIFWFLVSFLTLFGGWS